jgi:hypothetical protein
MKSADENLFLLAAAVGVGVIAYLAFANKAGAAGSAAAPDLTAQATAATAPSFVNTDMGGEDFGSATDSW